MFKYQELCWYGFGLKVGLLNLLKHKNALGSKKTLGKIFQPINSYTRFPEYYFFEQAVKDYQAANPNHSLSALDVGSPKLFGLRLAYRYRLDICLTDVTRMNLDEYMTLWQAVKNKAAGAACFEQQDARNLAYPDGQFDVVYAMSVIEHIEGNRQDSKAISELWRVLKPGGQLIISVPFGPRYIEQHTTGFAYTDEAIIGGKRYFFQRIYDEAALQKRILAPLQAAEHLQIWTISRRNNFLTPLYHRIRQRLGDNINGLFGFLNPLLSLLLNCHHRGILTNFLVSYNSMHGLKDIYADIVLACQKPK